jgi:hypothetical protein
MAADLPALAGFGAVAVRVRLAVVLILRAIGINEN